jgi:predicted aminopeptidase
MQYLRLLILVPLLGLAGCETLGYYTQSARGHLELMHAARDIPALLEDPDTPQSLKCKLQRSQQLRQFAVTQLALPDNDSYTRYSDVGRDALVWSVVAAPALGLEPRQWCYPLIGCFAYRGYFDRAQAHAYAQALTAEGWDAAVEPVPAYSTLGCFEDPLPSTVIGWAEADLAALMFHELAHQRLYARDDTAFNESYATVVEKEGVRRWLEQRAQRLGQGSDLVDSWREAQRRSLEFRGLIADVRRRLVTLYASDLGRADKLAGKVEAFAALQAEYRQLKQRWGGYAGYDKWMRRDLNNAHLAGLQTYSQWVRALRHLLHELENDLDAFHRACDELAALDYAERQLRLAGLQARAERACRAGLPDLAADQPCPPYL